MSKAWRGTWRLGDPDVVYGDGKAWRVYFGLWDPDGSPSAVYMNGKVWRSSLSASLGLDPAAVYMNGKIWRSSISASLGLDPDAIYMNGTIWKGSWVLRYPNAVYDGPDEGAASIALLLRII